MKFSGVRLRQAREAAGFTQVQLAHQLGLGGDRPESIVSCYERGLRVPGGARLIELAGILGVTPDAFWTYGPRKKSLQEP